MMKKKRELLEWTVLITVFSLIYLSGWHTVAIGKLQQAVLYTGVISPRHVENEIIVSYDFELKDPQGNIIPFNKFKNEVVFLNFWATWCPPCIAEMPDINSLYEQVQNVSFVMVSLDKDRQKAIDFVKAKGYEFPIYFMNSTLPNSFDINSIPTTYLIAKDGKMKVENHGMAKYNSKKFRTFLSELQ